ISNGTQIAYDSPLDSECFGTTSYEKETFMVDCTVTADAVFSWSGYGGIYYSYPADTDYQSLTKWRMFTVDTKDNWVQFGQLYCSASYDVDGAGPYVANTWVDVLPTERGKRETIGAGTTRFVIQAISDWGGAPSRWPTDPSLAGWSLFHNPLGSWDQALRSTAKITVDMPGSSVPRLQYNGPWQNFMFQMTCGRYLQVKNGTLKIHRIYLSSGT
ncbi:MAG: hypothetical protein M1423_02545, partial [Acidobacteria bacterium]|nr:hypothetical protein [Acidobacteriota bacterium]